MKISRYVSPHFLEVVGNEIKVYNKNGLAITGALKIKTLGDRKLSQLAFAREGIVRNDAGQITGVFMYELDSQTETPEYLFRLKLLGNLTIDQLV